MSTSIPLQSVGRALARIGTLRGARPGPAEAGGDSRAAVLEFIEAADDVVRVEDVAAAVGLHANTVRGHLDALLASGRISRAPDQRSTTGPAALALLGRRIGDDPRSWPGPWTPSSTPRAPRMSPGWRPRRGPRLGPTSSPRRRLDAAVDAATQALTDFGFDAVRNPVGDEITLRACPYAALVAEHPVICDIHAGLLADVLKRTGQPVSRPAAGRVPPAGPLRRAHLNRADAAPAWSVTPPPAQPDRTHRHRPSRRKK